MQNPKLEVTVMNTLDELALYSELCEGMSDQWTEGLQESAKFLEEQVFRQLGGSALDSTADVYSPQRRPLSRRAERGPGKSPSPSRNSSRHHSPAPYSPKRQHRARSPVTLDDFYDVIKSPDRHSPVPRFVDGSLAQSLTSDEFTCVSYSDPFSSPSMLHSSTVLALSSQKDSSRLGIMVSKDLGNTQTTADMKGPVPWLDTSCLSPEDPCLEDTLAMLEEGDFPGASAVADQTVHDGDLFLYEVDEEQLPSINRRCLTRTDSGHFLPATCRHPANIYDTEGMSQTFREGTHLMENGTESSDWKIKNFAQVDQVPVLESRERFLDILDACIEASNEEKIEEEMIAIQKAADCSYSLHPTSGETVMPGCFEFDQMDSASQTLPNSIVPLAEPHSTVYDSPVSRTVQPSEPLSFQLSGDQGHLACQDALGRTDCSSSSGAFMENPGFQCYSYEQRVMEELSLEDPSWCSLENKSNRPNSSAACPKTSAEMELDSLLDTGDGESNESTDPSILHQFSEEFNGSSSIFPDDVATYSLYSPPQGECPSSASAGTALNPSCTTTFPSQPLGKNPEDFALPRLVGSPPLQFSHCHNLVLIHNAQSNPYNPDLPTPPIVLTDHGPYYDPESIPAFAQPHLFKEPLSFQPAPTRFNVGSQEKSAKRCYQRGDVSKSRSCPSLNQTDSNQAWAGWDQPRPFQDNDMSAFNQEDGKCRYRNSFGSSADHHFVSPSQWNGSSMSHFGTPASQCTSRAAVIDRLRKVVEKRLSGSLDSLESRVH